MSPRCGSRKTLHVMLDELGDRPIAVVREATKMFEEVFRGTHFRGHRAFHRKEAARGNRDRDTRRIGGRGRGKHSARDHAGRPTERLMESGLSERDAVRRCTIEFKLPKRQVYAIALKLKDPTDPEP